jgi:hypothetical protein
MLQPAISTEHDIRANYTVWTDACAGTDFCTGINDGRRVNPQFTHFQPLTSILSLYVRGEAELRCLPALRIERNPGRLALCKGEREGEGWLRSFVQEREHQFGFGHDCIVHNAMAFRFGEPFAA